MTSHRAFPPGRGNLKIPTSSRRAAHAGLALYAPCRPKGRFARWVAWRLVDVFGGRAVPGRRVEWFPPMEEGIWQALVSEWTRHIGPFNGVAVHERAQVSRSGFAALLLSNGEPVGFVKVRDGDDAPLTNEFRALESVASAQSKVFEVPQPVATGTSEGWHFLVTTALRPDLHQVPLEPPLGEIVNEIRSGLDTLPRPTGIPSHWEPIHGDFTPWNLRQRGDGSLFLVDWEEASWAPPAADEAYYSAVMKALEPGGVFTQIADPEVQKFWRDRLRIRLAGGAEDIDRSFTYDLIQVMDAWLTDS